MRSVFNMLMVGFCKGDRPYTNRVQSILYGTLAEKESRSRAQEQMDALYKMREVEEEDFVRDQVNALRTAADILEKNPSLCMRRFERLLDLRGALVGLAKESEFLPVVKDLESISNSSEIKSLKNAIVSMRHFALSCEE